MDEVECRQLDEEVEVAGDEVVLGDDGDRVAELEEGLQAAARDPELALDRLVAVGVARQGHGLGLPGLAAELRGQQLGQVLLDQNLRLEVEAGGKPEVLVARPGVAVDAAVLAAAVGVDAEAEAEVGTVVGRKGGAAAVDEEPGARRGPFGLLAVGLDRVELDMQRLEAVGGVEDGGAAAVGRGAAAVEGQVVAGDVAHREVTPASARRQLFRESVRQFVAVARQRPALAAEIAVGLVAAAQPEEHLRDLAVAAELLDELA